MDQSIVNALAHEADGAHVGPGSDEYYASRFIPGQERYRAWCVLALKTVIEEIILRVSDPGVARLKLAWWQDADSRVNHPLFNLSVQLGVEAELLHTATGQLSTAIDQGFSNTGFPDENAQDEWYRDGYQNFYQILGGDSDLGLRLEQCRSLLQLRELITANVIRLSTTRLGHYDLSAIDFVESLPGERRQQFIHDELRATAKNLESAIHRRNARRGPVYAYAALTYKRIQETIADGGLLLERKVELTPIRKLWIAWRAQKF